MKKTLVLATVFSIALTGFGFATAKPACAEMMEQSMAAPADCCKDKCPCTIEERSNDQAMPVGTVLNSPDQTVITPIDPSVFFAFDTGSIHRFIEISPPRFIPLYQLFSVYRI